MSSADSFCIICRDSNYYVMNHCENCQILVTTLYGRVTAIKNEQYMNAPLFKLRLDQLFSAQQIKAVLVNYYPFVTLHTLEWINTQTKQQMIENIWLWCVNNTPPSRVIPNLGTHALPTVPDVVPEFARDLNEDFTALTETHVRAVSPTGVAQIHAELEEGELEDDEPLIYYMDRRGSRVIVNMIPQQQPPQQPQPQPLYRRQEIHQNIMQQNDLPENVYNNRHSAALSDAEYIEFRNLVYREHQLLQAELENIERRQMIENKVFDIELKMTRKKCDPTFLCSACLEPDVDKTQKVTYACGHCNCAECFNGILGAQKSRKNPSCPECRAQINTVAITSKKTKTLLEEKCFDSKKQTQRRSKRNMRQQQQQQSPPQGLQQQQPNHRLIRGHGILLQGVEAAWLNNNVNSEHIVQRHAIVNLNP